MSYASPEEAVLYYSEAGNVDRFRVEMILGDAADIVVRNAPPPNPVPTDYKSRAKRCELRVFEWLFKTDGGLLLATSVGGISETYTTPQTYQTYRAGPAALAIVRDVMGIYYRGPSVLKTAPLQRG